MIDVYQLKESDRGREVRYEAIDKIEYGRITSWNNMFVFVSYHTCIQGGKRTARRGTTSEPTRPEDLEFTQ